jgi:hypothetical protein
LPAGLKTLTESVLALTAIETVKMPPNLEIIGDFTFHACTQLKSVELNSCLKQIGKYAFDECTSLDNVVVPDSVTDM